MFSAWFHTFKGTHLTAVPDYCLQTNWGLVLPSSDYYFLQNTTGWSRCVQPSLIFVHIHSALQAQFFSWFWFQQPHIYAIDTPKFNEDLALLISYSASILL